MSRFTLENDNKQSTDEDVNNPYNTSRSIHEAEQQEAYDRDFKSITDNLQNDSDSGTGSKNVSQAGDNINAAESSASSYVNRFTGKNSDKGGRFGRFKKRKKTLIGFGVGGLTGILIAAFMALLPLQLNMFVENIYSQASRVPDYAVKNRIEYLVTRALSVRILQASDAATGIDSSLVFCQGGGVACSLFKTYTTDFFEKKYGISMEKVGGGVSVKIDTQGRTALGSKANTWVITTSDLSGDADARASAITSRIETLDNGQMKDRIRSTVDLNMKHSFFLKRMLGRKILMQKFGVTHWRAFPDTQKKLNDIRTTFRSKVIANTIGKVAGRLTMAMSCLSATDTCAKVYRELSTSDMDLQKLQEAVDNAETEEDRKRAQQKLDHAIERNKILRTATGGVLAEGADETNDTALRRFLSNSLVQTVGKALGIATLLDMLFSGIVAVDDGILDEIAMDISKANYVGLAFGDETGMVTNIEKIKAGHGNIDVLGVATSYFEGAEQSPLMAYENGFSQYNTGVASILLGPNVMAADEGAVSECTDGKSDTLKPTRLAPGELVCPEEKVVRYYSKFFQDLPGWDTIATVAHAWKDSPIGKAFDFVGQALGSLISKIPGLSYLIDKVGNLIKGPLTWAFGLVFDPQPVGPGATGAQNYVALSGGIRVEQHELMALGVDTLGNAAGAGGQLLSPEKLASINEYYDTLEQQEYDSKSYLAKLFDVNLKGSFTQQLALTAPTSVPDTISTLARMPTNILASSVLPQASAATAVNPTPFGMPVYGYADTKYFEADPTDYTPTTCEEMHKAREDSLKKTDAYPVQVYTKADPCALEKMVVGIALADAGITDDEYSLADPDGGMSGQPIKHSLPTGDDEFPIPSDVVVKSGGGWSLKKGVDYSNIPCAAGSKDYEIFTNTVTKTTVRTCLVDGFTDDRTKVSSVISDRVVAAIKDAKDMGITLSISSGYRTYEQQQILYTLNCAGKPICDPKTAVPGTSNHEFGVAVDWGLNPGGSFCYPDGSVCPGNEGYEFFVKYGSRYGFRKHADEAWHWSMDGF